MCLVIRTSELSSQLWDLYDHDLDGVAWDRPQPAVSSIVEDFNNFIPVESTCAAYVEFGEEV